MGVRTWRSGAIAASLAIIVALGLATPATGSPLSRVDYPTWDEVQAARGNEAATAATIDTITQLLAGLQAEAARLGDAAVARAAEADAAASALERATTTAGALTGRADAAAARAARSTEQAAQVAAALYRSGGSDLTASLLFSGDEFLYRLGALDKVGAQVDLALERADSDRNQADALAAQAAIALTERERLADEARAALAAAQSAEQAADAAVASEQANLTLLYEQLATLKNTTVLIEQQYAVGQQVANDPGPGTPGGGGGTDPGGFVVPGSEVNDVAGARAYAFAILGQHGFGADQNSCLLWLWNRESGWRTNAYNASSGAYGIPQSLPGSKMASWGADWRTNYVTQINWGITYIEARYGSPCGAWAHSQSTGWY
jgi:hypothetical protein